MAKQNDSKNIVNEIGSAYRTTPLLTDMLLLIVLMLGAICWHKVRNDDRFYEYVKMSDQLIVDSFRQIAGLAFGYSLSENRQKMVQPKTIFPVPAPPPLPKLTHRTSP